MVRPISLILEWPHSLDWWQGARPTSTTRTLGKTISRLRRLNARCLPIVPIMRTLSTLLRFHEKRQMGLDVGGPRKSGMINATRDACKCSK